MKLDIKLIYAALGSITTLLFVFVFKVIFLSDSLVPSTTQPGVIANCATPQQELTQSVSIEGANTQTSSPRSNAPDDTSKVEQQTEITAPTCNENCVKTVVSQLIAGNNIGDEDNGESLSFSSNQVSLAAAYLSENPDKIIEIETTLSALRDQSSRDTLLYVLSRLPDDQTQQVARKLAFSENVRDRMDGLSLLQSSVGTDIDVQNELKQIISTENNPDVLLNAIRISHSLDPEQFDSTTENRLTNLISDNSENDNIRSAALMAKTKIIKNDNRLKTDIVTALNSSSTRFKEAGIQALDSLLARQKRSTDGSVRWKDNPEITSHIERIANNPDADPRTRIEALNLIQRHFDN